MNVKCETEQVPCARWLQIRSYNSRGRCRLSVSINAAAEPRVHLSVPSSFNLILHQVQAPRRQPSAASPCASAWRKTSEVHQPHVTPADVSWLLIVPWRPPPHEHSSNLMYTLYSLGPTVQIKSSLELGLLFKTPATECTPVCTLTAALKRRGGSFVHCARLGHLRPDNTAGL